MQTYCGAHHGFKLDQSLAERLRQSARECSTTLYCVLLAAFQTLLQRYSGQVDISVGSPMAGRNQRVFENVMGYLANPVVLNTHFGGKPSFRALLSRVRQTVLGAMEHQAFPFQVLVEELHPERDMSRSPLYQVLFALQKPHRLEEAKGFVLGEGGRGWSSVSFPWNPCPFSFRFRNSI